MVVKTTSVRKHHKKRDCKKKDWESEKRRKMGGGRRESEALVSETVKGLSGTLESVDNVEGGDSLALGVFSVGDGITDDV